MAEKIKVISNLLEMTNPEQYRSIDCGDKQCSLSHRILQNCVIYLHTNNTECAIPCKLDGCKTEMHHYINCPIWECTSYTTTTMTTTSSTATTTNTPDTTSLSPPSPNPTDLDYYSLALYISLGLNALFATIIIVLSLYIKKTRTWHQQIGRQSVRQRRVSLLPNNNRYFTLASEDDDSNDTESTAGVGQPLLPTSHINYSTNVEVHRPSEQSQNPSVTGNFDNVNLDSPPTTSIELAYLRKDQAKFANNVSFTTFKETSHGLEQTTTF